LQEGRENANIDAGLGFIWRISVETIANDAGRRFMIVLNGACACADISLVRMTVSALIAVSLAGCATDYCSNIQDLPPLVDLGPGQTYHGYEGGLYPGANNVRPAAHDAAGRRIAQSIVPEDANGNPDPVNGKIVYTIMSVSNGYGMWHSGDAGIYGADPSVTFMTRANADPAKNPKLTVAYGFEWEVWEAFKRVKANQGAAGQLDARDPNDNFYDSTDFALREQGLTPLQVQIVWLFIPASPSWANVPWHTRSTTPPANILSFPRDAEVTKQAWKEMIYAIRTRYPTVKIIYISTKGYTYRPLMETIPDRARDQVRKLAQQDAPIRLHDVKEAIKAVMRGPGDAPGGPIEPWNHDMGWSVKWLIEDQINGDPFLNYDPARGAVNAPWISWGPYFWTYGDGTPRAYDGFSWNCGDVYDDGLHLNHSGMYKEASLLLAQMTSDPTATPWFLGSAEVPPPVESPPVVEEPPLRKH
jgi:hypothetical protein